MDKLEISPTKVFVRLLLGTLLILAFARLALFAFRFGQESLQMDFTVYYTAGESLNHGLSPYKNYIANTPSIWDGVSKYNHSRFLYPPLVAAFFQPIALLPYVVAKNVWMVVSFLCMSLAMVIAVKTVHLKIKPETLLVIGMAVCLFHPMLIQLERGQIDTVTLALIMAAVGLMIRGDRWLIKGRADLVAGGLLAVATLLKLHCVYIVPFLVLRKQWKVLAGYVGGCFVLLILSFVINGYELSADYWLNQLPRISMFGEFGTDAMKLPDDLIKSHTAGLHKGSTSQDGRTYSFAFFGFAYNATLVRVFSPLLSKLGISISQSTISFTVFVSLFSLIQVWHGIRRKLNEASPIQEFIYWQIVLMVVLLASPTTWTMNVVWLLPIVVVILHEFPSMKERNQAVYFYLAIVALLLAGVPDSNTFNLLVPYGKGLLEFKYVVAEILLVIALLGLLTSKARLEADEKYALE